jgi:hypothetical protein
MNDERHESLTEGIETRLVHEIVVDEDVLSYSSRAALEQVGSATGFVLALALVCALLPRAAKVLAAGAAAAPAPPPALRGEASDDRAMKRRALDEHARGDSVAPSGSLEPVFSKAGEAELAGGPASGSARAGEGLHQTLQEDGARRV